jgi:YesN/AraC family two-component response regulator
MIKVIIVEDNNTIRSGLKTLIDGTDGYACIGEFRDCESMLKSVKNLKPDIVLMDIGLPGISGI